MKRIPLAVLLTLAAASVAPSAFADSNQRLIPAGSLISCSTGDSKISSKTTAVGDPILCKVEHRRGDFMLPYDSYLGGELSEYKDPGHFVGKGWMQLEFDRLYVGGTAMPLDAKVVDVPGYKIDQQGRILGKGHAVRDTITWMIPILWPIDLINLPRRGPRPTLKEETPLTLRVMEDLVVPATAEPQRDPYGLIPRQGADNYAPPPPTQYQDQTPQYSYAPANPAPMYAPDAQQVDPNAYAQPPAVAYAPAPYPVAPPAIYGGIVIAPRVAYGPGYYAARPPVIGYGPRVAVAPRMPYGYGYAGRAAVGPGMQARVGGGAMLGRSGFAARGGFRGR